MWFWDKRVLTIRFPMDGMEYMPKMKSNYASWLLAIEYSLHFKIRVHLSFKFYFTKKVLIVVKSI